MVCPVFDLDIYVISWNLNKSQQQLIAEVSLEPRCLHGARRTGDARRFAEDSAGAATTGTRGNPGPDDKQKAAVDRSRRSRDWPLGPRCGRESERRGRPNRCGARWPAVRRHKETAMNFRQRCALHFRLLTLESKSSELLAFISAVFSNNAFEIFVFFKKDDYRVSLKKIQNVWLEGRVIITSTLLLFACNFLAAKNYVFYLMASRLPFNDG